MGGEGGGDEEGEGRGAEAHHLGLRLLKGAWTLGFAPASPSNPLASSVESASALQFAFFPSGTQPFSQWRTLLMSFLFFSSPPQNPLELSDGASIVFGEASR